MKHQFTFNIALSLLSFVVNITHGQPITSDYFIQEISDYSSKPIERISLVADQTNSFRFYKPIRVQPVNSCYGCNAIPKKIFLFGKKNPVGIKYTLNNSYDPHSMKEVRLEQNEGRGDCIFAWGILGALIGGISAKSSGISTGSGVLSGFLIGGLGGAIFCD